MTEMMVIPGFPVLWDNNFPQEPRIILKILSSIPTDTLAGRGNVSYFASVVSQYSQSYV